MEVNLKNKKPDIRYLNDMKEVLYDRKWAKTAPNFELYYMYRGIKKKNDLRYDITIIPTRMLGQEFVKTKGHEHLGKFGEVYIVLEGQAIFLMQKTLDQNKFGAEQGEGGEIQDVYAIKAKKGEVAVIPPYYGHITINPGKKDLKLANWVSENCKNNYKLIEKMQGACYYYTKKGWIKNKNYKKVPKLRFEKPLKLIPKDLSFLKG